MSSLQHLIEALPADARRPDLPFGDEISDVQEELWKCDEDGAAGKLLSEWLARYQPCLFGRVAAKEGLLRFCFLREGDLQDEGALRNKIQLARTGWKREAWRGEAHGFLIVLLSRAVAFASPSDQLLRASKSTPSDYETAASRSSRSPSS